MGLYMKTYYLITPHKICKWFFKKNIQKKSMDLYRMSREAIIFKLVVEDGCLELKFICVESVSNNLAIL